MRQDLWPTNASSFSGSQGLILRVLVLSLGSDITPDHFCFKWWERCLLRRRMLRVSTTFTFVVSWQLLLMTDQFHGFFYSQFELLNIELHDCISFWSLNTNFLLTVDSNRSKWWWYSALIWERCMTWGQKGDTIKEKVLGFSCLYGLFSVHESV